MIRQLAEERPGVQPGPAGWFLEAVLTLERADNPQTGFWGAGGIISAQKPAEGNCIYRPVRRWLIIDFSF